jgi:hypothetical protein
MWSSLVLLDVWYDTDTNPFGYKALYSAHILKNPPQGFMYFHSWENLYQVTIIPLTLGVAVLTHGWTVELRRRRAESRVAALLNPRRSGSLNTVTRQ